MPGSKNSRSRPRRGNCRGRGSTRERVNSTSSNESYRSQHKRVGNRGRGNNRERDNSRGSYSAKVSKENDSTIITDKSEDYEHATPGVLNVSNLQEKKHDWELYKTSLELFHCHRMLRNSKEKEDDEVSTNQSSASEYSDDDCIKSQPLFKPSGNHIRSVLPNNHHKKRHCYRSKKKKDVPPNKFINLSIFPSRQDIINESPFLRSNIVKGEYENCEHYLDVQFRLFREDYISPLRDGIKEYKERIKECKERFMGMYDFSDVIKRLKLTYIYEEVKITNCELDSMFGLIHTLCFKPLPSTYSWDGSSRLQAGTLLCLSLDEFVDNFIFATVAIRTPEIARGKITVCFEEWQHDILFDIPASKTCVMLEMRSAYFESYRHTLSVLKEFNEANFPLKQYIVKAKKKVEAPCYLDECTLYDFSPILKKETFEDGKLKSDFLEVPPLNLEKWPNREELGLDFTQYNVLKAALTKEFCIIQGPPGTGKTFMGLKIVKMLLHNMNVWYPRNIDYECPILIVCYTNHALDQFLERILEFTNKIVRVGEQSQSEILEPYTLQNLRSQANNIASAFHHDRKRLQKKQDNIKDQINSYNFVTEAAASVIFKPKILKKYIKDHYESLVSFYCNKPGVNSVLEKWLDVPSEDDCNEIVDCTVDSCDKEDDDMSIEEICSWMKWELCDDKKQSSYGWNKPAYKKHKECIKKNMSEINMMTAEEVTTVENILDLEVSERWRLYRFWVAEFITFNANIIKQLEKEFVNITKELRNTRWGKDLAIVRHANIVGVTCTGTAKYHYLIEALAPQIVVIEEAAEVLEAHLISSLPKSTKHLILIGDHQQLRPLPSVYELAVERKLDVSLFERMVKNEVEYSTLVSQHRMRPCIADLLVDSIYNELSHHESVYHYDDIIGIERNMHFISHVTTEAKLESSYYNLFEAKMIVRLLRYFLLQGYEASQITVLATYSRQVKTIRDEVNQIANENKNVEIMMKDVKVTTVDNYQGEENDIIIVSFVRSNLEGNLGFLKAPNRVCVALSRARKGLYCVGNFEFLASESKLWESIVTKLKKEEAISSSITLICQNHSFRSVIEYSSDFKNVFDGGCKQICGAMLKCEHICKRFCHSIDTEHRQYKCEEKCRNRCKNGHPCEKKCHEPCGNCTKNKIVILPDCGHRLPVPCYIEDFSEYKCEESCSIMLRCGHACTKLCYESCEPCMRKVPKTLACKHTVVIECFVENIKCTQQCRYAFPCGHQCPKSCGEKCPETCKSNVVIQLPCNHVTTIPCIKRNEKIVCTASCNHILSCGHNCPGNCTKCLQGEKHVECWRTCGKIVSGGRTCKLRCGHSNKCDINIDAKTTLSPDFGNKSESSKWQHIDRHIVNKWKTGYDDEEN